VYDLEEDQHQQKRHDSFRDDEEDDYGEENEEVGDVAVLPERRPSAIKKQRTKPNVEFKSHLADKK